MTALATTLKQSASTDEPSSPAASALKTLRTILANINRLVDWLNIGISPMNVVLSVHQVMSGSDG